MFKKVKCYYNPIVKHHSNGEMSVTVYITNSKKSYIDMKFYDRDYKKLMNYVIYYVKIMNESFESSFKKRFNAFIKCCYI